MVTLCIAFISYIWGMVDLKITESEKPFGLFIEKEDVSFFFHGLTREHEKFNMAEELVINIVPYGQFKYRMHADGICLGVGIRLQYEAVKSAITENRMLKNADTYAPHFR